MNTIEKRSLHVHDRIMKMLGEMMDQVKLEGWDGREFFIGTGLAFRAFCARLQVSPEKAVEILKSLNVPQVEASDSATKVVSPSGRPLGSAE